MVTAAARALGVLELDDDTLAEKYGQLFKVLSALTDGESFNVVTSQEGAIEAPRLGASCTRGVART